MIGRKGSFIWCFGISSIGKSRGKRSMSRRTYFFLRKRNIRMNMQICQACILLSIMCIRLLCYKFCNDHEVLHIASY